jgi:ribonucleoside-diphosphate reductase alpha chain
MLNKLKAEGNAPQWMNDPSFKTLSKGYMLDGETPKDMYRRVAKTVANKLNKPEMEDKFFDYMWKNWLCPATPVLSNSGTDRGLVISCFGETVPDSVDGIYKSVHEMAMLSKFGGGVGVDLSNIRGRGVLIKGGANGASEGVTPWAKVFDSATIATSQGNVRRGATSLNLRVDHVDIEEFLRIRRPLGDVNRQCLNIHQCVQVTDAFMKEVADGNMRSRNIWKEILKTRLETGEPYIQFIDNVNKANPQMYKDKGLEVNMTNICSEIMLFSDVDHSFVCCLSSLNLTRWEEWKDTDLVETSIWFLDGVMSEFIDKARGLPGFERAVRFAEKSRALGLGVLGWHTLLQQKQLPFESFASMQLNALIFKKIREKADIATRELALEYGEPEWCVGYGVRNSHLLAVAPTASNSIISGGVSAGIEPIMANAFAQRTAKGVFLIKNITLEELLETKGKNDVETWKNIVANEGSVQQLNFLSAEEKEIFLTAYEINQSAIIRQASQRQKYIDQGQSLNLFFPADADPAWFHKVHKEAHEGGIKALYYLRSSSVLKADNASRQKDESCKSCEG